MLAFPSPPLGPSPRTLVEGEAGVVGLRFHDK